MRPAIIGDLGIAATFIASNYLTPFDLHRFQTAARELLDEVERQLGWMYLTRHTDGRMGQIDYTVWSAVYGCPQCGGEVVFVAEALDASTKRTRDTFPCPTCGASVTKRRLQKRFRLEAIRAGVADLWGKRDYGAIIKLCERLPDEVVQEDPALLMYYDNAVTRQGAG